MKQLAAIVTALSMSGWVTGLMAGVPCDASDATFACGLSNPEDMVHLADTPWIVATEMNLAVANPPDKFGPGSLQAVRIGSRQVSRLYPSSRSGASRLDAIYTDCSAPPHVLSPVGLNVRVLGPKRFRLLVTNHGERESIEIIDVTAESNGLHAVWRGCVLIPRQIGVWGNGVAPLPDDGLVLTGYNVALWYPHHGWRKSAQFNAARPGETGKTRYPDGFANGVEVSGDHRWLFVADSNRKTVVRIAVDGHGERTDIQLDFIPDNLRWGDDGRLYVAGPFLPADLPWEAQTGLVKACMAQNICDIGFAVAAIDPKTLTASTIFHSEGIRGKFGLGSTAVKVGAALWISTAHGDRMMIVTSPGAGRD